MSFPFLIRPHTYILHKLFAIQANIQAFHKKFFFNFICQTGKKKKLIKIIFFYAKGKEKKVSNHRFKEIRNLQNTIQALPK